MGEFATDWHRQEYIEAVEREIHAIEQRLEQFGGDAAPAALKTELTAAIKKAKDELARVKRAKPVKDEGPAAGQAKG